MKTDKILSLLGIAEKAGCVASGEFLTEKAVKTGKAYLVIAARDASGNTKKKCSDMCAFYQVPYAEYADKEQLAHCIGKEIRASLAVTNEGLAKSLIKHLESISTNYGGK